MLGKDTLDSLRKETWYKAHRTVQELDKEYKRGKGRPSKSDEKSNELTVMKKKAKDIKSFVYALGKTTDNLTPNQLVKKEMLARTYPILYKGYVLKER